MDKSWVKIGIIALFLASFILILGNIRRIIASTAPDFSVLWLSAQDLTLKLDPYLDTRAVTPNGYPPVSLIFYVPLSLISYQTGQAIFTLISFAATVAAAYLSIKMVAKKVDWQIFLLVLSLAFLSFPTKFSFGMGQINMVVLFLLLLSVWFDRKKKPLWAGILFGISVALKPLFLFFILFFALKKSWKSIFIALAVSIALTFLTLIFWPPSVWVSWLKIGILPLSNLAGREVYYNQGLMGFISRIFTNLEVRKYLTGIVSIVMVYIASIFVFKKKGTNLTLSLFIITLILVDSLSWQHHFVWLIFPFVVLTNYVIKSKRAVLLVLLALAYILISWNFKNPLAFPAIFLSNQFYGAAILWVVNYRSVKMPI